MYNKVISGTVIGLTGVKVQVETDISDGLPMLSMVGYLSSCVKEAGERVRTALKNSGYSLPPKRITINLSPADIRKDGTGFDLPIATGILAGMGIIPTEETEDTFIAGELSLDGALRHISGMLPLVHFAANNGIKRCIVPWENANEAALIPGIEIIPVKSLNELVDYLNGVITIAPVKADFDSMFRQEMKYDCDFSEVTGQEVLKRGVEIAAAGLHNILMTGAAGSGKSMVAKRIPTILPELTFEESIEITKIYSVAGMLDNDTSLIARRPFRSPHHTISKAAMSGGGVPVKPGEITLSHNGVLFLDEIPEFPRNILEILRQPLEDREIHISRINNTYRFPADFMLVAARNTCPCGNYPDMNKCTCSYSMIRNYQHKISRPLLDRIDIYVYVTPVSSDRLFSKQKSESSEVIRERVADARRMQAVRYKNEKINYNSQLSGGMTDRYIKIAPSDEDFARDAFEKMELSMRGWQKLLKVSRTIADLDGDSEVRQNHIKEAVFYRNKINGEDRIREV